MEQPHTKIRLFVHNPGIAAHAFLITYNVSKNLFEKESITDSLRMNHSSIIIPVSAEFFVVYTDHALQTYSVVSNSARQLPPPPSFGDPAAIVLAGELLYFVGGGSPGTERRFQAFDLRTGQWSHLPPTPRPIKHAKAIVVQKNVLVFSLDEGEKKVDVFDTKQSVWVQTKLNVPARFCQIILHSPDPRFDLLMISQKEALGLLVSFSDRTVLARSFLKWPHRLSAVKFLGHAPDSRQVFLMLNYPNSKADFLAIYDFHAQALVLSVPFNEGTFQYVTFKDILAIDCVCAVAFTGRQSQSLQAISSSITNSRFAIFGSAKHPCVITIEERPEGLEAKINPMPIDWPAGDRTVTRRASPLSLLMCHTFNHKPADNFLALVSLVSLAVVRKVQMKNPRSSFALCIVDNEVFCLGGKDRKSLSNVCDVLDLATGVWRDFPPLAVGRSKGAAVRHNGKLYLFGGKVAGEIRPEYSTSIEVFQPHVNQWQFVGVALPARLRSLVKIAYSDSVVLFGQTADSSHKIVRVGGQLKDGRRLFVKDLPTRGRSELKLILPHENGLFLVFAGQKVDVSFVSRKVLEGKKEIVDFEETRAIVGAEQKLRACLQPLAPVLAAIDFQLCNYED